MKRTTILLIFLFFSGTLAAQSLSITSDASKSGAPIAEVTESGISVSESSGVVLITGNYKAPAEDPSLETYSFPDGSFIVRENIANFLVYDSYGRVKKSISNSSQSEGGESISELATDQHGKTIVLYNPKVIVNGVEGSRAKIINTKSVPMDIYYSQDRALSVVEVSANGEFIAFASTKIGSDDEVQLMDRFGNNLNTIDFDQPIKGVSFSENGLFVTIYSGSRAAAYEVVSGERVGSTSFRNTSVIFAGYDPSDKTIIGLTGSGNSTISDVQLHAVNVAARKIAREDFSTNLEVIGQISMVRTAKGSYKISGLDKDLNLNVSF